MIIETKKLQEMVTKVSKAADNNRFVPLTNLIGIRVEENILYLTCTDSTNYLEVSTDVDSKDFNVVVSVDLFSRLIGKITVPNVSVDVFDTYLQVDGNGTYKLDLHLDENGKYLVFPNKFKDRVYLDEKKDTITKDKIQKILSTNKAALAVTVEQPCYTAYYVGDQVITSDSYKMTVVNEKCLTKNCLIGANTMELLGTFDEDFIDVYYGIDELIFKTVNMKLYTRQQSGIDLFDVKAINRVLGTELLSNCTFNKNKMLSILDRISLFVNEYDRDAIKLSFSDKRITVTNLKDNGVEVIECSDMNGEAFECKISIRFLQEQLKAYPDKDVYLAYGTDFCIMLKDDKNNVVQVIALLN